MLDRSVKFLVKPTSSRSKGSLVIPWVRSKVILTNLLADADVSLADEDAGVVDGLGQSQLEDLNSRLGVS